MKDSTQKAVVGFVFFILVCGVLTVLQNSFLSQFSFQGQLPTLLLSFVLTDIYFKEESYLVELFKAAGAAFFLSLFSAFPWPVFLGAVTATVSFFRFSSGLIRRKNIINFILISFISLLFYHQMRHIILFLERNQIRLITTSNIVSSFLTLFCSLIFYFFYVRITEIKKN